MRIRRDQLGVLRTRAGRATTHSLYVVVLVLAFSLSIVAFSSSLQTATAPLTKDEIANLLKGSAAPTRIIEIVKQRGLGFSMDKDIEQDLRQAGAGDELVKALWELAPKPPVLEVQSAPGNAAVFVDGKFAGSTDPNGRLSLTTISTGRHAIVVKSGGYLDHNQTVDLAPGLTVKVPANLELAQPSLRGEAKPVVVASPQIETVESPPGRFTWVSHGRVEGHLALTYSPDGAFSADSTTLAVVNEDKVVLMNLREAGVHKVLRPRLPGISDLEVQSANYLASNVVFLLGTGLFHIKGKGAGGPTPLLAFQWNTVQDIQVGKLDSVGAKGGFGAARYFPQIGYLGLYKESNFDLWNPRNGTGGRINVPTLTQQPNLYTISPDGHWLVLAQIAMTSNADPVVVDTKEHRFVDSLRGHQGTVLGLAFSRDGRKVLTACEDGKVRIFSAPDWKPLHELAGHSGPVHWAEFSPDEKWVASAGEDKTVRIWSADEGKLVQTLEESRDPLLTVAFAPNGDFVVASAEKTVLVWQRTPAGQ